MTERKSEADINYDNKFSSRWRQIRACARCHRLKMRCAYDDPSYKSCKRCFAIGVECSPDEDPTAQFARKKRRRTKSNTFNEVPDSSLSTINKLLSVNSSTLESLRKELSKNIPNKSVLEALYSTLETTSTTIGSTLNSEIGVENTRNYKHSSASLGSNIMEDIIYNEKFISLNECKLRFNFFLNRILSYYPIISLPQSLKDFNYIMQSHPYLLAACILVTTINDNDTLGDGNIDGVNNDVLYSKLSYHLESFISDKIYVKSEGFSFHLIYICLIISLWRVPSNLNNYKNRLTLLMAYNISLCIDLGDIGNYKNPKYSELIQKDESVERNDLRAFLTVYCCCGSLGLALPKFKLVSWTKNHDAAVEALMMKTGNLPTSDDNFLCYFAKIVCLGQEMIEFVSPDGIPTSINASVMRRTLNFSNDILFSKMWEPNSMPMSNMKYIISNYEGRLYEIVLESGFFRLPSENKLILCTQPKESYLMSIMYYQLLVSVYDSLVSSYLYHQEKRSFQTESIKFSDEVDKLAFLQHIVKLIQICENLLNLFIRLNDQTINYPTFFYYRPMHALVLLIRLRLLTKSQYLSSEDNLKSDKNLNINVEHYFNKLSEIIQDNPSNCNSVIRSKMSIILSKISKWMTFSANYKGPVYKGKENVSVSIVNLMNMSKEQEIENLKVPKLEVRNDVAPPIKSNYKTKDDMVSQVPLSYFNSLDTSTALIDNSLEKSKNVSSSFPYLSRIASDPTESTSNYTIQDIFNEIDSDMLNYLNPLESNFNNDSFQLSNEFSNSNLEKFSVNDYDISLFPHSGMSSISKEADNNLWP